MVFFLFQWLRFLYRNERIILFLMKCLGYCKCERIIVIKMIIRLCINNGRGILVASDLKSRNVTANISMNHWEEIKDKYHNWDNDFIS